jgi:hypothetical protein
MTTPMGPTIISTTVLSSDGKKILVGENQTIKAVVPGMSVSGSPMTNSVESEYQSNGSGIVRTSVNINGMLSFSEPPERICGTLPSQWTVTTKASVMGVTTLTQSTMAARSLGKEKITVPAGTFDATVVEIRRREQLGGPSASSVSVGDSVHVIYAVENVGFVKVMVTVSMPHLEVAEKTVNDAVQNLVVTELQTFVVK